MAALSAHAPTRPIDPFSPLPFSVRTKALERNWEPRSLWTTVPFGSLSAIALWRAETAREASSGNRWSSPRSGWSRRL